MKIETPKVAEKPVVAKAEPVVAPKAEVKIETPKVAEKPVVAKAEPVVAPKAEVKTEAPRVAEKPVAVETPAAVVKEFKVGDLENAQEAAKDHLKKVILDKSFSNAAPEDYDRVFNTIAGELAKGKSSREALEVARKNRSWWIFKRAAGGTPILLVRLDDKEMLGAIEAYAKTTEVLKNAPADQKRGAVQTVEHAVAKAGTSLVRGVKSIPGSFVKLGEDIVRNDRAPDHVSFDTEAQVKARESVETWVKNSNDIPSDEKSAMRKALWTMTSYNPGAYFVDKDGDIAVRFTVEKLFGANRESTQKIPRERIKDLEAALAGWSVYRTSRPNGDPVSHFEILLEQFRAYQSRMAAGTSISAKGSGAKTVPETSKQPAAGIGGVGVRMMPSVVVATVGKLANVADRLSGVNQRAEESVVAPRTEVKVETPKVAEKAVAAKAESAAAPKAETPLAVTEVKVAEPAVAQKIVVEPAAVTPEAAKAHLESWLKSVSKSGSLPSSYRDDVLESMKDAGGFGHHFESGNYFLGTDGKLYVRYSVDPASEPLRAIGGIFSERLNRVKSGVVAIPREEVPYVLSYIGGQAKGALNRTTGKEENKFYWLMNGGNLNPYNETIEVSGSVELFGADMKTAALRGTEAEQATTDAVRVLSIMVEGPAGAGAVIAEPAKSEEWAGPVDEFDRRVANLRDQVDPQYRDTAFYESTVTMREALKNGADPQQIFTDLEFEASKMLIAPEGPARLDYVPEKTGSSATGKGMTFSGWPVEVVKFLGSAVGLMPAKESKGTVIPLAPEPVGPMTDEERTLADKFAREDAAKENVSGTEAVSKTGTVNPAEAAKPATARQRELPPVVLPGSGDLLSPEAIKKVTSAPIPAKVTPTPAKVMGTAVPRVPQDIQKVQEVKEKVPAELELALEVFDATMKRNESMIKDDKNRAAFHDRVDYLKRSVRNDQDLKMVEETLDQLAQKMVGVTGVPATEEVAPMTPLLNPEAATPPAPAMSGAANTFVAPGAREKTFVPKSFVDRTATSVQDFPIAGFSGLAAGTTWATTQDKMAPTLDGMAKDLLANNLDLLMAKKDQEIAKSNLEAMGILQKWFQLYANVKWTPRQEKTKITVTTTTTTPAKLDYTPSADPDQGTVIHIPTAAAARTKLTTEQQTYVKEVGTADLVNGELVFRFEPVNLSRTWETKVRAAELLSREADTKLVADTRLRSFYENAYEVALLNDQMTMADRMIFRLKGIKTDIQSQPGVTKTPESFRIIDSKIKGIEGEKEVLRASREARLVEIKRLTNHRPNAEIQDPAAAFTMENVQESMEGMGLSRNYIEARILAAAARIKSGIAQEKPLAGVNATVAIPEVSIATDGTLRAGLKADLWLSNQDLFDRGVEKEQFQYDVRNGVDQIRQLQNQLDDDFRQLDRLRRDHQRQAADFAAQEKVVAAMQKAKMFNESIGAVDAGRVTKENEGQRQPVDYLSANINSLSMESQMKGTVKDQELVRMRIGQADQALKILKARFDEIQQKHPKHAEYIRKALADAGLSERSFEWKAPVSREQAFTENDAKIFAEEDQSRIEDADSWLDFYDADGGKNADLLDRALYEAAAKTQLSTAREKKDVDALQTRTVEWGRVFASALYGVSYDNSTGWNVSGLDQLKGEIGVGIKATLMNISYFSQKVQTRLSGESADQYFDDAAQRLEAAVRSLTSLLRYQRDLVTAAGNQLSSERRSLEKLRETVDLDTKARGAAEPRDELKVQLAAAEANVGQAETKLLATRSNYAGTMRALRQLVNGTEFPLNGLLASAKIAAKDSAQAENILDPFPGVVAGDGTVLASGKAGIEKLVADQNVLVNKLEAVEQHLARDAAAEKNPNVQREKQNSVREIAGVRAQLIASSRAYSEVLAGGQDRASQYHRLMHATQDSVAAGNAFLLSRYLLNSGSYPKFYAEFETIRLALEKMAAMPDIDNMLGLQAYAWNLRVGVRRETMSVLDGGVAAGYFWDTNGDGKAGVGPFWNGLGYGAASVVDLIPLAGPLASRLFYDLKGRENRIRGLQRDYQVIALGSKDALDRFMADQEAAEDEYRTGLKLIKSTETRIAYEKEKAGDRGWFRVFSNLFTSGDRSTRERDMTELERWNEQLASLKRSVRDQKDRLFQRGIDHTMIDQEVAGGTTGGEVVGAGKAAGKTVEEIAKETVPYKIAGLDMEINQYLARQKSRTQMGVVGSGFNEGDALFEAGRQRSGGYTDQTLSVKAQFYLGELIWDFEGQKRDSIDQKTRDDVETKLEDQKHDLYKALNKYEAEKHLYTRLIPEEQRQVKALVERAHALKVQTLEATDQEKMASQERLLLMANRILEAERSVLEARSNFYKATGFSLDIESVVLGSQTDFGIKGVDRLLKDINTGKIDAAKLSEKNPEVRDTQGVIKRLNITREQIMTRQASVWARFGLLNADGQQVLNQDITAGTSIQLWGGDWWSSLKENALLLEKMKLMDAKDRQNFEQELWSKAHYFESTGRLVTIYDERLAAVTGEGAYETALQNVLKGNQGLDYFKNYLNEVQNAQRAFHFAYFDHRGAEIDLVDFLTRNKIDPKILGLSMEGLPVGKARYEGGLLVTSEPVAEKALAPKETEARVSAFQKAQTELFDKYNIPKAQRPVAMSRWMDGIWADGKSGLRSQRDYIAGKTGLEQVRGDLEKFLKDDKVFSELKSRFLAPNAGLFMSGELDLKDAEKFLDGFRGDYGRDPKTAEAKMEKAFAEKLDETRQKINRRLGQVETERRSLVYKNVVEELSSGVSGFSSGWSRLLAEDLALRSQSRALAGVERAFGRTPNQTREQISAELELARNDYRAALDRSISGSALAGIFFFASEIMTDIREQDVLRAKARVEGLEARLKNAFDVAATSEGAPKAAVKAERAPIEEGRVIESMDLEVLMPKKLPDGKIVSQVIDDKLLLYPALKDRADYLLEKMGKGNLPANLKILFANQLGRVAERHNLLKTLTPEQLNERWIIPLGEFYARAAKAKLLAKAEAGGTMLLPGDKWGNLYSQDWNEPVVMSGLLKESLRDAGIDFGEIGFADFFARMFDMVKDDPELLRNINAKDDAALMNWVGDLIESMPKTKIVLDKVYRAKGIPLSVNDPYEIGNILAWSVYAKMRGVELTEAMLNDPEIRVEVEQMMASYNFNKLVGQLQGRRMMDFSTNRPAAMEFLSMVRGHFKDGKLVTALEDHPSEMKIRAFDESLMRIQALRQISNEEWPAVGYIVAQLMQTMREPVTLSNGHVRQPVFLADEQLILHPGAAPAREVQKLLDRHARGEITLTDQNIADLKARMRQNLDDIRFGVEMGTAMGLLDDLLNGTNFEREADRKAYLSRSVASRLTELKATVRVALNLSDSLKSLTGPNSWTGSEARKTYDLSYDQEGKAFGLLFALSTQLGKGKGDMFDGILEADGAILPENEGRAWTLFYVLMGKEFDKDAREYLKATDKDTGEFKAMEKDKRATSGLIMATDVEILRQIEKEGLPLKGSENKDVSPHQILDKAKEVLDRRVKIYDASRLPDINLPVKRTELDAEDTMIQELRHARPGLEKLEPPTYYRWVKTVLNAKETAGKDLSTELEGYTKNPAAKPFWMLEGERQRMAARIEGKDHRPGLKEEAYTIDDAKAWVGEQVRWGLADPADPKKASQKIEERVGIEMFLQAANSLYPVVDDRVGPDEAKQLEQEDMLPVQSLPRGDLAAYSRVVLLREEVESDPVKGRAKAIETRNAYANLLTGRGLLAAAVTGREITGNPYKDVAVDFPAELAMRLNNLGIMEDKDGNPVNRDWVLKHHAKWPIEKIFGTVSRELQIQENGAKFFDKKPGELPKRLYQWLADAAIVDAVLYKTYGTFSSPEALPGLVRGARGASLTISEKGNKMADLRTARAIQNLVDKYSTELYTNTDTRPAPGYESMRAYRFLYRQIFGMDLPVIQEEAASRSVFGMDWGVAQKAKIDAMGVSPAEAEAIFYELMVALKDAKESLERAAYGPVSDLSRLSGRSNLGEEKFLSDYADWFLKNYRVQKDRQARERSGEQQNLEYEFSNSRKAIEDKRQARLDAVKGIYQTAPYDVVLEEAFNVLGDRRNVLNDKEAGALKDSPILFDNTELELFAGEMLRTGYSADEILFLNGYIMPRILKDMGYESLDKVKDRIVKAKVFHRSKEVLDRATVKANGFWKTSDDGKNVFSPEDGDPENLLEEIKVQLKKFSDVKAREDSLRTRFDGIRGTKGVAGIISERQRAAVPFFATEEKFEKELQRIAEGSANRGIPQAFLDQWLDLAKDMYARAKAAGNPDPDIRRILFEADSLLDVGLAAQPDPVAWQSTLGARLVPALFGGFFGQDGAMDLYKLLPEGVEAETPAAARYSREGFIKDERQTGIDNTLDKGFNDNRIYSDSLKISIERTQEEKWKEDPELKAIQLRALEARVQALLDKGAITPLDLFNFMQRVTDKYQRLLDVSYQAENERRIVSNPRPKPKLGSPLWIAVFEDLQNPDPAKQLGLYEILLSSRDKNGVLVPYIPKTDLNAREQILTDKAAAITQRGNMDWMDLVAPAEKIPGKQGQKTFFSKGINFDAGNKYFRLPWSNTEHKLPDFLNFSRVEAPLQQIFFYGVAAAFAALLFRVIFKFAKYQYMTRAVRFTPAQMDIAALNSELGKDRASDRLISGELAKTSFFEKILRNLKRQDNGSLMAFALNKVLDRTDLPQLLSGQINRTQLSLEMQRLLQRIESIEDLKQALIAKGLEPAKVDRLVEQWIEAISRSKILRAEFESEQRDQATSRADRDYLQTRVRSEIDHRWDQVKALRPVIWPFRVETIREVLEYVSNVFDWLSQKGEWYFDVTKARMAVFFDGRKVERAGNALADAERRLNDIAQTISNRGIDPAVRSAFETAADEGLPGKEEIRSLNYGLLDQIYGSALAQSSVRAELRADVKAEKAAQVRAWITNRKWADFRMVVGKFLFGFTDLIFIFWALGVVTPWAVAISAVAVVLFMFIYKSMYNSLSETFWATLLAQQKGFFLLTGLVAAGITAWGYFAGIAFLGWGPIVAWFVLNWWSLPLVAVPFLLAVWMANDRYSGLVRGDIDSGKRNIPADEQAEIHEEEQAILADANAINTMRADGKTSAEISAAKKALASRKRALQERKNWEMSEPELDAVLQEALDIDKVANSGLISQDAVDEAALRAALKDPSNAQINQVVIASLRKIREIQKKKPVTDDSVLIDSATKEELTGALNLTRARAGLYQGFAATNGISFELSVDEVEALVAERQTAVAPLLAIPEATRTAVQKADILRLQNEIGLLRVFQNIPAADRTKAPEGEIEQSNADIFTAQAFVQGIVLRQRLALNPGDPLLTQLVAAADAALALYENHRQQVRLAGTFAGSIAFTAADIPDARVAGLKAMLKNASFRKTNDKIIERLVGLGVMGRTYAEVIDRATKDQLAAALNDLLTDDTPRRNIPAKIEASADVVLDAAGKELKDLVKGLPREVKYETVALVEARIKELKDNLKKMNEQLARLPDGEDKKKLALDIQEQKDEQAKLEDICKLIDRISSLEAAKLEMETIETDLEKTTDALKGMDPGAEKEALSQRKIRLERSFSRASKTVLGMIYEVNAGEKALLKTEQEINNARIEEASLRAGIGSLNRDALEKTYAGAIQNWKESIAERETALQKRIRVLDLNDVLLANMLKKLPKGVKYAFEKGELVLTAQPWLMDGGPEDLDKVVNSLARILIGSNFKQARVVLQAGARWVAKITDSKTGDMTAEVMMKELHKRAQAYWKYLGYFDDEQGMYVEGHERMMISYWPGDRKPARNVPMLGSFTGYGEDGTPGNGAGDFHGADPDAVEVHTRSGRPFLLGSRSSIEAYIKRGAAKLRAALKDDTNPDRKAVNRNVTANLSLKVNSRSLAAAVLSGSASDALILNALGLDPATVTPAQLNSITEAQWIAALRKVMADTALHQKVLLQLQAAGVPQEMLDRAATAAGDITALQNALQTAKAALTTAEGMPETNAAEKAGKDAAVKQALEAIAKAKEDVKKPEAVRNFLNRVFLEALYGDGIRNAVVDGATADELGAALATVRETQGILSGLAPLESQLEAAKAEAKKAAEILRKTFLKNKEAKQKRLDEAKEKVAEIEAKIDAAKAKAFAAIYSAEIMSVANPYKAFLPMLDNPQTPFILGVATKDSWFVPYDQVKDTPMIQALMPRKKDSYAVFASDLNIPLLLAGMKTRIAAGTLRDSDKFILMELGLQPATVTPDDLNAMTGAQWLDAVNAVVQHEGAFFGAAWEDLGMSARIQKLKKDLIERSSEKKKFLASDLAILRELGLVTQDILGKLEKANDNAAWQAILQPVMARINTKTYVHWCDAVAAVLSKEPKHYGEIETQLEGATAYLPLISRDMKVADLLGAKRNALTAAEQVLAAANAMPETNDAEKSAKKKEVLAASRKVKSLKTEIKTLELEGQWLNRTLLASVYPEEIRKTSRYVLDEEGEPEPNVRFTTTVDGANFAFAGAVPYFVQALAKRPDIGVLQG
ncbi:MAG TPA: hypothetical protein PLL75_05045, partial [Candidatus Omnitrophota bacterium]|nr:hypothetical protein [Candidatus Omnitrophota bacterium]